MEAEGSYLQTQEISLETDPSSQPLEGANPANALTLNF